MDRCKTIKLSSLSLITKVKHSRQITQIAEVCVRESVHEPWVNISTKINANNKTSVVIWFTRLIEKQKHELLYIKHKFTRRKCNVCDSEVMDGVGTPFKRRVLDLLVILKITQT